MTRPLMILLLVTVFCGCMPQVDNPLSTDGDEQAADASDGSVAGAGGEEGSDTSDAGGSGAGSSTGGSDKPSIPRPSWLVINEILYDIPGPDSDGDSFIELAGEAGTDIGGYEIAFVNGSDGKIYDTIKLPEGLLISDDTVFVIADAVTGSPGTSHVGAADYIVNFDPQNGPDAVQLLDDVGGLVDAVGYGSPIASPAENGRTSYEGSPAEDVGSGISLSRVDTLDTNDNSSDFIQLEIPSPGVVESPVE